MQVERKSDGKVYALKRVNISKMSKREVSLSRLHFFRSCMLADAPRVACASAACSAFEIAQ